MKWVSTVTLMLLFSLPALGQTPDTTTLTKTGQVVPDFSVTTIEGKVVRIAELRGKIVLINFFATWCGPCMGEMPHVEKEIWLKMRSEHLVVLAIGREHSTEELVKFNKEKGFTFLIAPDPKREVYRLFAKQFIPRNYLIGRDGKIIYQSMGYSEEEFGKLVELIRTQLKAGA